jgi:hypothetical protein
MKLIFAVALFIVAIGIWFFSFEPYKEKVEELQRSPTPGAHLHELPPPGIALVDSPVAWLA